MATIYVITWRYSDGSGFGVVRAYYTQGSADLDKEMLCENSDGTRQFEVVAVPVPLWAA